MGIKGIYGEIGPGERIALSKLAVEKFEQTGRPLRIAIDVSIWQFQIQSGKGGSNPALRTLYYRLVRLLSSSIQPLFVFDGPDKPPFKRNVRTHPHVASLPNFLVKQMLKLFGFPYYSAPGEAEAECALLQKEAIVDAVLSEDVDTLMFGCGLSMRNWSSEGARGNKSPTHVNVYHSTATKRGKAGLESEGMIMVALMSGGDYIPAGIPGCGVKIACEAARAGFGKDLCSLSRKDTVGMRQWRERLQYELRTNESGHFRTKHKALRVPEDFPDKNVLGYYTHPAVSPAEKILQLKQEIQWDAEPDVPGLRHFVAEAFEWQNRSGAKKFIRGLAPAMLVHRLRKRGDSGLSGSGELGKQEQEEASIIAAICGRRTHFITDGTPELRLAYIPADLVGLDLGKEEPDVVRLDGCSDSENEPARSGDDEMDRSTSPFKSRSTSPAKRRATSAYDPTQPERIWVLETYAKIGVPLTVETWEENMRDPKKFASRKARERSAVGKGGIKKGAMDAYVQVTKPCNSRKAKVVSSVPMPKDPGRVHLSPVFLAPMVPAIPASPSKSHARDSSKAQPAPSIPRTPPKKSKTKPNSLPEPTNTPSPNDNTINPWTLARRPCFTMNMRLRRSARYSALGIYGHSDSAGDNSNDLINDEQDTLLSPARTPSKYHGSPSPPLANADIEHPSPRKKSTPTRNPRQHYSRPTTPTSSPTHPRPFPTTSTPPYRGPPRRLASHRTPPQPSSPLSLPSPSTLLLSLPPLTNSNPRPNPAAATKSPRSRKLVVVRESLDGAWKEVAADTDTGRGRGRGREDRRGRQEGRKVWRRSEVEVVDMTGSACW
ncbi:MAG: hypothetical protein FRX48_01761 [Lasallia pustulata]|uniref:Flap structure-specific endonuclease n=1 Tax=Lasallia pustulata TaxID=136370 RepID=A0A5M8Q1B3_9LECA|nr:MAG: hypothetical protein FRX48_01761 [Lasallia pustulata]